MKITSKYPIKELRKIIDKCIKSKGKKYKTLVPSTEKQKIINAMLELLYTNENTREKNKRLLEGLKLDKLKNMFIKKLREKIEDPDDYYYIKTWTRLAKIYREQLEEKNQKIKKLEKLTNFSSIKKKTPNNLKSKISKKDMTKRAVKSSVLDSHLSYAKRKLALHKRSALALGKVKGTNMNTLIKKMSGLNVKNKDLLKKKEKY
jgi:hypothetical protein